MFNPAYSTAAVVNAAAGGVMMCFAVFHTRSIWMSVGLHLGWNFIVSGAIFNGSLVTATREDGRRIGQAAMEATVPAAVLVLAATAFVVALPRLLGRARLMDARESPSS